MSCERCGKEEENIPRREICTDCWAEMKSPRTEVLAERKAAALDWVFEHCTVQYEAIERVEGRRQVILKQFSSLEAVEDTMGQGEL